MIAENAGRQYEHARFSDGKNSFTGRLLSVDKAG